VTLGKSLRSTLCIFMYQLINGLDRFEPKTSRLRSQSIPSTRAETADVLTKAVSDTWHDQGP